MRTRSALPTEGAPPMSTVYNPPVSAGSEQAPAPSAWPSPGGPFGPAGPPGYGGGGEEPGRPVRRPRGRYILAAGAAVAVLLGAFFGLHAATPVMTTAQIAAQTDPGLVDVVSTLSYQQATAS